MTEYQIIEQNNASVAMMRNGNLVGAISNLTAALVSLKQRTRSSTVKNITAVENETVTITNLDQIMIQTKAVCCQALNQELVEQENLPYIYRHGIFIPSRLHSQYVMIALIFNLALAHHLIAANGCRNRQLILQKAFNLYKLAYKAQGETDGPSSNHVFLLAITNNVALIYLELNESKASKAVFDNLLSTILLLISSNSLNFREGHCIEGFLHNALANAKLPAPAA